MVRKKMDIDELLKTKREEILSIAAKYGSHNVRIFGLQGGCSHRKRFTSPASGTYFSRSYNIIIHKGIIISDEDTNFCFLTSFCYFMLSFISIE